MARRVVAGTLRPAMKSIRRFVAILFLLAPVLAQGKSSDDEVARTPVDPYTGGDLTVLLAAGLVGYGPFVWADGHRTEDIDRVLGEGRVLWLETEHFRIGCNLRTIGMPTESGPRKALLEECKALHQKLPKVSDRPKRLDPWLRLHLYAQRAERIYAEFAGLVGPHLDASANAKEPPNGKYLGLPDKFLLLLFQKKSDLARYLDRFCGVQGDRSYGFYHNKTYQMLFGLAAEGLEAPDDAAVQCHFVYGLVGSLVTGYRGYAYQVPPWLSEGLAHYYSRPIETSFINITVKDDDSVNAKEQHEWERKVRARAQFDRTAIPFDTMMGWQTMADMGYHDHLQSWSRISYLMQVAPQKVGELLFRLKGLPAGTTNETLRLTTVAALKEVFGLEPATFDAAWREWVLKTYSKK